MTPKPPQGSSLVGRTFGQYHVLSMIQRGGMGEIYLAELEPHKIKVVIKRLQDTHDADERYVEMFQNEAAVMSELEHPNVVKVLGVPILEDRQCLVMEFVRGRNLQQVLRKLRSQSRLLAPNIAIHVMRKVLLGLSEAHQARFPDGRPLHLVHRDVKPGNILISFAGDVKITDFGIAKSAIQQHATTAGVVKGTVRYLSPEQIRSEQVTFHSDLFSCASVLVEILTDQPLYDRGPVAPTLMAILNDDRAPVAELLPFRAPALAEVLERALGKEPKDRFSSATEFASALGAASRELGPVASDDDVGALLRQLFQGPPIAPGERPDEDVTYLVANEQIVTPVAGTARPVPKGAEPLDALDFSDDLPPEVKAAEARARAMLEGRGGADVVFAEPVELDRLDELEDLDFDELELEVDEDATDALDEASSPPSADADTTFAPEPSPERTVPEPSDDIEMFRMKVEAGTRIPSPVRGVPQSTPMGRIAERSGEYALVDAELARAARAQEAPNMEKGRGFFALDEHTRLRLLVLVGCLTGVVLTVAVFALTR